METTRVDICYRPLRIGWAIRAADTQAFRQAVRFSHALWGGRFNPILVVDQEDHASRLVDLFRLDFILPVGTSEPVRAFQTRFPHLRTPAFLDALFTDSFDGKDCQVLDIQNALAHLHNTPASNALKERGVWINTWQEEDTLTDVLLVQFGEYPPAHEVGIDYRGMMAQALDATEHAIDPQLPVSSEVLDHPSIASFSRYGLERHYSAQRGHDSPGFFVGDASSLDDLVCHWNLRAAAIPLLFVDLNHLSRYASVIPAWEEQMQAIVAQRRHEFDRYVAVWSQRNDIEEIHRSFGERQFLFNQVSSHTWNGLNVQPPMMSLGERSTLAMIESEGDKPRVSFQLPDKPFCSDVWFHRQRLVASLSFIGGLYGDEHHTLGPPFIPELNEFYSRTMHYRPDSVRIESGRVGLIIDATDTDAFLFALPIADLADRVFDMAGLSARPSPAGLIVRQLISRLGGLQGAKVFKIPGVRRLLKLHGPTASIRKQEALHLIGSSDPENPNARFRDYENLYIEQRASGTKLDPKAVFGYLVEKGLFRIGADVTCPSCRLDSWVALDVLKQRTTCELCGHEHDATRQLVDGAWSYRRSGVLGVERNAQGAVPVALTLQQLGNNLREGIHDGLYSTSLELEPKHGISVPKCEVDFVWLMRRRFPRKTAIILGECKDRGSLTADDVENLRRVADALPRSRFETFVLFAKLCPFTPEEIERAKVLNENNQQRAILLSAMELEPLLIYDRAKVELKIREHGATPEELASATRLMYFTAQPTSGIGT